MSWTSNGFFRNINILTRLDEAAGNSPIAIYQPGTLNPLSLAANVRYSGFITSLRLYVDLRSISEVEFPTPTDDQSEGEINAAIRNIETISPKKQLNLLLQRNEGDVIKIASLWLFNRRPYYSIDLLVYYTDAAAYDVASDIALLMQLETVGYGLLEGQDVVTVHGSAVEEAENTAPSLFINVTGGGTANGGSGSGGDGGSTPSSAIVTDSDGQPITDRQGNPITNA